MLSNNFEKKINIEVIYEDKNFLCVDKPRGLVIHWDGRTVEFTLIDWLKKYIEEGGGAAAAEIQQMVGQPHTLDSERYINRWGIVNRLDRDTAGLILIAKNNNTFIELQKLFLEKNIKKKYQARVWGEIDNLEIQKLIKAKKIFILTDAEKLRSNFSAKQEIYKITEPILRHKNDPRIWICGFSKEEGSRVNSKNVREVITYFGIENYDSNKSEVNLYPVTGRTHQLRLHLRFLGHPIIGDDKYGINGKINFHSTRDLNNLNINTEVLDFDQTNNLNLIAKKLTFQFLGNDYDFESKNML